MKREESQLQRNCVKWFRYEYKGMTKVLFSIPNGGYRTPFEAMIMKGEGVVAGVADLFLMEARGEFHGLFIEMKVGKNKQTIEQKEFEKAAKRNLFAYVVCRSFDDFKETIINYLKL